MLIKFGPLVEVVPDLYVGKVWPIFFFRGQCNTSGEGARGLQRIHYKKIQQDDI